MYQYDVFISYNIAQLTWVRRLVEKLRSLQIRAFFDRDVGLAGAPLHRAIAEGMLASRSCLIVLTPESAKSRWVGYEIQKALHQDPDSAGRFVIPLLRKDCDMPLDLDGLVYIDCRHGLTEKTLAEIVKAIGQRGAAEFVGSAKPPEQWKWSYAPKNLNLSEMAFHDVSRFVIVGDQGAIFRTTNGGRTWVVVKSDAIGDQELYSVVLRDDGKNGWIVGAEGTVLSTDDGGTSWRRVPCSIDDDLMAVRYCDGGQAICVVSSRGTILRRSLRSGRWNYVRTPGGRFPLWSLDFSPDGSLGCAVGGVGTIFVSQDAGRTWKKGETGVRSSFICSTVLSDGKTICIVGDEGRILMSRNGGRDWEDRSSRLKLWDNWLRGVCT